MGVNGIQNKDLEQKALENIKEQKVQNMTRMNILDVLCFLKKNPESVLASLKKEMEQKLEELNQWNEKSK